MTGFLKEYIPSERVSIKSKDIIDEFIASGNDAAVIDLEKIGKKSETVYAGLRSYIERHELKMAIRQESGDIVIEKTE